MNMNTTTNKEIGSARDGKDSNRVLLRTNHAFKKIPTSVLTQQVHSSFIDDYLGDGSYVFVTINLEPHTVGRLLTNREKHIKGGTVDFIPLGQEWLSSIRSGASKAHASERMMEKFFVRLNQKTLGSKYRFHHQHLRVIGVHENATTLYSRDPANHIHMLVEVPRRPAFIELNRLRFQKTIRGEFDRLIYPTSYLQDTVLDIRSERLGEDNPHRGYILKQLVSLDVAADRVFFPSRPRDTKNDRRH